MSQEKREIVDSNWDRIHKTHYAVGSSNKITSSYSTEETPSFKHTASYCNPHYERPSAELWSAAVEDAKQVRKQALENAKEALEEVCANHPKLNTNKQKTSDIITSDDMVNVMNNQTITGSAEQIAAYEEHVKTLGRDTVGRESTSDKVKKQTDVHKNFISKMSVFPKHLSYEGSVVLCVMLSMNEVAYPHLSNLPFSDQSLIKNILSSQNESINPNKFKAKFDSEKNFILMFSTKQFGEFEINVINSVAHPRPEDLKGAGVVPVEKDGDKIEVGGKIILNRKGIEKLIGVDNSKKNDTEEEPLRRQPVAGRNAFEIRTDVMQMALDYSIHSKSHLSPEEIVNIAKKFYTFVENKR